MSTILLQKEASDFLESHTAIHTREGEDWYFIPFWYKKVGEDTYEITSFDHLPENVKEVIRSHRNEPQTISSQHRKLHPRSGS